MSSCTNWYLAAIYSWFKEKEAINSYEKMLKSARCFPGGGSRRWAWAPCCLCASPSTQREEAGGDSKLVLGGWAAFAWRRRRRKRSRWSGEKAWSSHLWLGRPLSSKPPSVLPFYSCNMITRMKKTNIISGKINPFTRTNGEHKSRFRFTRDRLPAFSHS